MRVRLHILVALSCFAFGAMAQDDQVTTPTGHHKWSVYGGIGPSYYFNNLVQLKNRVNEFSYSFSTRIMWEPEHLLSLGFETGYYRLYTVDVPQPTQAHIANVAIPFQVVVSMKFAKTFYFNFSMGHSLLLNKVDTQAYGNFDASNFSLADIAGTLGYKKRINERFTWSAETKLYHASKLEDTNLALLFMVGYGFK